MSERSTRAMSSASGGSALLPLTLGHCRCQDIGQKSWRSGVTGSFQTDPVTTVEMFFATSPMGGLTLNINGTDYVTPPYPGIDLPFPIGAPVTVKIPNPQFLPGDTGTRYALAYSSDNPATAVFAADHTQSAFFFIPQHKLTLTPPAGGSLTANPPWLLRQ